MINACSRFGKPEVAIQLCMEIPKAKKKAESIHVKYKQFIISGLKFAAETEKIHGNGFVIINALGFSTVASIYMAVAITFSSTVIIIKLLSEKHDLQSLYGKIIFIECVFSFVSFFRLRV